MTKKETRYSRKGKAVHEMWKDIPLHADGTVACVDEIDHSIDAFYIDGIYRDYDWESADIQEEVFIPAHILNIMDRVWTQEYLDALAEAERKAELLFGTNVPIPGEFIVGSIAMTLSQGHIADAAQQTSF